jgi:hypothetical protein
MLRPDFFDADLHYSGDSSLIKNLREKKENWCTKHHFHSLKQQLVQDLTQKYSKAASSDRSVPSFVIPKPRPIPEAPKTSSNLFMMFRANPNSVKPALKAQPSPSPVDSLEASKVRQRSREVGSLRPRKKSVYVPPTEEKTIEILTERMSEAFAQRSVLEVHLRKIEALRENLLARIREVRALNNENKIRQASISKAVSYLSKLQKGMRVLLRDESSQRQKSFRAKNGSRGSSLPITCSL